MLEALQDTLFSYDENNIYNYKNINEYSAPRFITRIAFDGSGQDTLCNKADCLHNDTTCNAATSYGYSGNSSQLYMAGGNLYSIFTETELDLEGWERPVKRILQKRDVKGNAASNIYEFPAPDGNVEFIAFDGRYLFFKDYFYSDSDGSETTTVTLENGTTKTLNAYEAYLTCVDTQTGQAKYVISTKDRRILGVLDDKILMREMVLNDMGLWFDASITLFSPGTGSEEILFPQISSYYSNSKYSWYSDGYFFGADRSQGEDNAKIILIDARKKTETVLVEKVPGLMSDAFIFGGKLFYSFYEIAETGYGALAVDIETKEIQNAIYVVSKEYGVTMPKIIKEHGENYIITYHMGVYSIGKEDYWLGKKSMTTLVSSESYYY